MNNDEKRLHDHDRDTNPDPVTGQPGSHPVGTGIGAAGVGAAATAVGGVVGGPVGAAVGAVAGGIVGGLMGKGVAESIDPTAEDQYWRENYMSRPYYDNSYSYADYEPAYRMGYQSYGTYYDSNRSYDDVEPELRDRYNREHGSGNLNWEKAKHATRDAWHRVENSFRQGRHHHDS